MSVVLKPFHVKDTQNYMYLATDPHLKIFRSKDPPEAKFELFPLKKHILIDLHTFSQLFKNSRSTSSHRGTRCRLYICYFSIVDLLF